MSDSGNQASDHALEDQKAEKGSDDGTPDDVHCGGVNALDPGAILQDDRSWVMFAVALLWKRVGERSSECQG